MQEGLGVPLLALRCRGLCASTQGRPLGAKRRPQLTAGRKWVPLVYSCMELDFGSNLNVLGSRLFPESPNKTPICQHLDFGLVETRQEKQSKQPRLVTYITVT